MEVFQTMMLHAVIWDMDKQVSLIPLNRGSKV